MFIWAYPCTSNATSASAAHCPTELCLRVPTSVIYGVTPWRAPLPRGYLFFNLFVEVTSSEQPSSKPLGWPGAGRLGVAVWSLTLVPVPAPGVGPQPHLCLSEEALVQWLT